MSLWLCRKVPSSIKSTDAGNHGSEKHSSDLTGHLTIFPLELIDRAFSRFRHKNVVHLSRLKDGLNVLELWHGVTYAFKDLSLSCTGQFLQYFLERKQKHVNILVGEYHGGKVLGQASTLRAIILQPSPKMPQDGIAS